MPVDINEPIVTEYTKRTVRELARTIYLLLLGVPNERERYNVDVKPVLAPYQPEDIIKDGAVFEASKADLELFMTLLGKLGTEFANPGILNMLNRLRDYR